MKKPLVLFLLLGLFFPRMAYAGTVSETLEDWSVNTINFNTDNPYQEALRITNTGTQPVAFEMNFNGGLFYHDGQMIAAIARMDDKYPGEPLQQKAFRYVRDHRRWWEGFTMANWYQNPLINLNTLGANICGIDSRVLSLLFYKMGYESRTNWYANHGVAGVKADGRWEVYDTTYGVFYRMENGEIANEMDLAVDSSPILNPVQKMAVFDFSEGDIIDNAYQQSNADVYKTQLFRGEAPKFNSPEPVYESVYSAVYDKLQFKLPPNGSFLFPAKLTDTLPSNNDYPVSLPVPSYANLEMDVPTGYVGDVDAPFMIQDIKGQGEIKLKGVTYDLSNEDSAETLRTYLLSWSAFNHNVELLPSAEDVHIIYVVNPKMLYLTYQNFVDIRGVDGAMVNEVHASVEPLPPDHIVKNGTLQVLTNPDVEFSVDGIHWYQSGTALKLPTGSTRWDDYILQFRNIDEGNAPYDQSVRIEENQTTLIDAR